MKRKGGHFKQKSEPTIIGANKDEPDTADLLENMKNRQTEEGEPDQQQDDDDDDEDNDEGMGDVDIEANGAIDANSDDEQDAEERKE